MGQNSFTSFRGKAAGIALLGEREIEPGTPANVEISDFRGQELRTISFYRVDFQSQFIRDPMAAHRSATNL